MAKVQSRRSISFGRADFDAAQEAAARLKIPLAQLAGQALREFLARNPEVADIGPPRPVAAQAVVDDLYVGSPFRAPCQLMGCGAAIGQACRPVPTLEGEPDPELAVGSAHKNRMWSVALAPRSKIGNPGIEPSEMWKTFDENVGSGSGVHFDPAKRVQRPRFEVTIDSAGEVQRMLDERVGVLSGSPAKSGRLTVANIHRIAERLAEADNQASRDPDGNVLLPVAPGSVLDQLIENSSIGAGLRNIEENGLEAELEDLEQDLITRTPVKSAWSTTRNHER